MSTRKYTEMRINRQDLEPSGLFGFKDTSQSDLSGSIEFLSAETYTERRISKIKQDTEPPASLMQVILTGGELNFELKLKLNQNKIAKNRLSTFSQGFDFFYTISTF